MNHVGKWISFLVIAGVLAAGLGAWPASQASAAPLAAVPVNYLLIAVGTTAGSTISTADDTSSGGTSCTLRDAIGIVNAGTSSGTVNGCDITQIGSASPNVYVINLPASAYVYTLNGSELDIFGNRTLHLVGGGTANSIIQASATVPTSMAGATHRVVRIQTGNIFFYDLTIRHGRCAGACTSDGSHGGGIRNTGKLTLTNSLVTKNYAASQGGGIWSTGTIGATSLLIDNTVISENTAQSSGGGALLYGVAEILNGSKITANTGSSGGGIYLNGQLTITNSTIGGASAPEGNTANSTGGGIYFNSNDTVNLLNISNSTVAFNTANSNGGGVAIERNNLNAATATFSGVTFSNNKTASNSGGGLYVSGGMVPSISDSTFTSNQSLSDSGGAIYVNTPGLVVGTISVITNTTFSGNTSYLGGGAIYNNGGTIGTVSYSTFSNNTSGGLISGTGSGGAIYSTASVEGLNITESTFDQNKALRSASGAATGGAIHFQGNSALSISNSTFSNNEATGNASSQGGALFRANSPASDIYTNVTFSGNTTTGSGGAVYHEAGSTAQFIHATIANNTANTDGGGLSANASISLIQSLIANNNGGSGANCSANITDGGGNVEGDASGTYSCGFASSNTIDARIGTLGNNGGNTQTIPLLAFSPALDTSATGGSCPATDQRGQTRVDNDGDGVVECDAGAFESSDVRPSVISITRASANPTSAASVDFNVTFSESVTDVDVSDFALTTTGLTGASVSAVSGSGASYTVTVQTGYKPGTLRLDIPNIAFITDASGYPLTNLPFTTGETYTVNKTPTFVDVPFDYWSWQFIESIYNAGITGGCSTNPLSYCPTSSVTRAQMAVFLLRGVHGGSYAPPAVNGSTGFTDVAVDYWAAAWIKQLAVEGITGGCGVGLYCPENTVTRDQMAVFLLKAKYGSAYAPPAVNGSTGFTDVPADYWAAAWIKQLAAEAITGGCGGGNYCPGNPVTRDQMAVFLQRTFSLPLP